MKGKNIKSIIALLLITLMMVALVGCGKSKADRFLDKMKKLVDESLELYEKVQKDPLNEALQKKGEELEKKYEEFAKEAEEIAADMSEEEQTEFAGKVSDILSKLFEIGGGGF